MGFCLIQRLVAAVEQILKFTGVLGEVSKAYAAGQDKTAQLLPQNAPNPLNELLRPIAGPIFTGNIVHVDQKLVAADAGKNIARTE